MRLENDILVLKDKVLTGDFFLSQYLDVQTELLAITTAMLCREAGRTPGGDIRSSSSRESSYLSPQINVTASGINSQHQATTASTNKSNPVFVV